MLTQGKHNEAISESYYKNSEPIKAEDFAFTQHKGIGILRINSSHAIFSDASKFKSFCDSIFKNSIYLVVDFSRCKTLDPAFIGAIVLSLKNSRNSNLEIRLVINDNVRINYCHKKTAYELFEVFNNLNDAIQSYDMD